MSTVENSVTLTGFAGSDAELKEFGNNKRLARVSIAVGESFKNSQGEEVKTTHWFNLIFWNEKADEAYNSIKKGTRLNVVGRLSTQHYEAKDGSKRYAIEIVVNDLILL